MTSTEKGVLTNYICIRRCLLVGKEEIKNEIIKLYEVAEIQGKSATTDEIVEFVDWFYDWLEDKLLRFWERNKEED
jgi:hypothetical protein